MSSLRDKPSRSARLARPGVTDSTVVIARHYLSQLPVRIVCRDGRIAEIENLPEDTPTGDWVAPGLVDLQVNGYAGVDFQAEDNSKESLLAAIRGLRQAGCTRFLLTLVTDEWSRMLAKLASLRALRGRSPELAAAIAGWHLEGPFLSPEPGFCGAHEAAFMVDPRPEQIRELRAAAGDDLVLLTLAPERSGALAAITLAVSLGLRVSLGHTDASAAVIAQAIEAGASGFTHLGNGCPQSLDRHDNILWRVLETRRLTVSLIPDGMHVSPPLFRLVHRLLPVDAVIYVSDAMAAAGASAGRYRLGRMELEVGADQVVRLPGQPYFAGSALRPIDAVWRAAAMAEVSWQTAWRRFSQVPAEWMGLPCGLGVGQRGDFCLVPSPGTSGVPKVRVFVGGREVESGNPEGS